MDMAARFCKRLNLNEEGTDYFCNLVDLARVKSKEAKGVVQYRMKKVLSRMALGFLIFLVFCHGESFAEPVGDRPGTGWGTSPTFEEGYRDAIEGISSRCERKWDCPSQDPYKRGYKLGYQKGIRELKDQGIRPLIDSPGKTIGSDFNGDGIHDVIIGAYKDDNGGLNEGAAYVIYGASTLSGTKDAANSDEDVTIFGKTSYEQLGFSVASAGDVNGDGMDDILVGANEPVDTSGFAYLFFGSTSLSATLDLAGLSSPDLTVIGNGSAERMGDSVSAAGDLNGDGFDDIIVGSSLDKTGGGLNSRGAAYVIFGAGNLSGTYNMSGGVQSPDLSIIGKANSDALGESVSGAGDVNGDGFDDLIVGAYANNDGGTDDEGAAYVFFGASNLSGTKNLGGTASADVTFLGKASNDFLGRSVSGAGDVNGDGFDDLIVGAPDGTGIAYVIFGASNLSGTKDFGGTASADVTVLGKALTDLLGRSVSGAGDVNDDGFNDIIVGAPQNNDGGTDDEGAAYLFFGASDLSGTKNLGGTASADVTFLGRTANDFLGRSVSGVGDVNADGIPDMIIGATHEDRGAGDAGAAYVIFGSTTISGTKDLGGLASADATLIGSGGSDYLGLSVGGGRSNPGP